MLIRNVRLTNENRELKKQVRELNASIDHNSSSLTDVSMQHSEADGLEC